jgi:hypothetical protein
MSGVVVEGKMLGRRAPLFPERSLAILPAAEAELRLPLREFINHVVQQELGAFAERHEQRSLLSALTQAEIEQGAARGRVLAGVREEEPAPPDPAVARRTALQAFEDGLYLVVVDGVQHRSLDEEVRLTSESRVTFLRLVALAGG